MRSIRLCDFDSGMNQIPNIHRWLTDRDIPRGSYTIGFGNEEWTADGNIKLFPVLNLVDDVLEGPDLTEFILRFGI